MSRTICEKQKHWKRIQKGMRIFTLYSKKKKKQYERLCTTVIATKSTLIFYDIGSIWGGAH